ncbi:MAG TPA: hypothetical protein O0X51_07840 [Methanocorpusculum sp.]|nr:hypothetical protein [Methanocorpusculum sp.]HJK75135.1 hypothetical protein [Methanocorpusculum sp.]HJK83390.1 hypothetical protein [Methanocorpusculum sp.]
MGERSVQLINYTPHTIGICQPDGTIISIPSSGEIRVMPVKHNNGKLPNGVQLQTVTYQKLILPDRQPGTWLIVSGYVVHRAQIEYPDRTDLICPDTSKGSLVRNSDGKIIAVRKFIRVGV